MTRKTFSSLPEECSKEAYDDGIYLFRYLQEKHNMHTIEGCDQILNALCVGLCRLMKMKVDPDDYPIMLQLIHKIVSDGVKNV